MADTSFADWYLRRKLCRTSKATVVRALFRVSVIRVMAPAWSLVAMLIIVWLAALGRVIADQGALSTLDTAQIDTAARVQADLLPVLVVWAALLLMTPSACSVAFLVADLLAGIAGYLQLSPPPFLVTSWVSRGANALFMADTQSGKVNAAAIATLLAAALVIAWIVWRMFRRLDPRRDRVVVRVKTGFPFGRLIAAVLTAIVLLLIVWGGNVVRIAAAGGGNPDLLWVALFACPSLAVVGASLAGKLLEPREIKLN
jgi:hypothetical protein